MNEPTPRNDKLTSETIGCDDKEHLILLDKLSRNLEQELNCFIYNAKELQNQVNAWEPERASLKAEIKEFEQAVVEQSETIGRLTKALAESNEVRDEWCREFTKVRDELVAVKVQAQASDHLRIALLTESYRGCQSGCLHCGEINEQLSHALRIAPSPAAEPTQPRKEGCEKCDECGIEGTHLVTCSQSVTQPLPWRELGPDEVNYL